MTGNSVKLPIKPGERAYASFMRQMTNFDERPVPEPLAPADRVIHEALATLADVSDRLVATNVAVLGHLPEAVRLKLSRLILAAAEKAETAQSAFANYARQGTLAQPRPRRDLKRRSRP